MVRFKFIAGSEFVFNKKNHRNCLLVDCQILAWFPFPITTILPIASKELMLNLTNAQGNNHYTYWVAVNSPPIKIQIAHSDYGNPC